MLASRVVLTAGLLPLCAASGSAQSFVGTKVVETGVNYPGVGTFTQLIVRPSISGTLTSFGGNLSTGLPALALSGATAIIKIADTTTTIPGGTGVPFDTFSAGPVGLSGSVYAFKGSGTPPGATGNLGNFSNATGSLNPVAAVGTAYPGGGIFRNVTEPSVSGTTIAFTGTSGFGAPIGVFTRTGSAAVVTVADTSTAMPNGAGNFSGFVDVAGNGYLANISGANVVFGGRNAAGTSFGLFLSNGSTLSTVATNDTTIPNLGGTFSSISPVPAISGSNVAFSGTGAGG